MEEKINTVLVSIIACDSLCTRNVLTHEYGLGARNDAFSSFSTCLSRKTESQNPHSLN